MDTNKSTFGCVANSEVSYIRTAIFIHSYVFASLFILLAAISSFSSFRIIRGKRKAVKFLLIVEVLMITFGLMRALFLLADPYRVRQVLPALLVQCLEDLAVPCLTSAFMFVQTTFWQLTKLRRLQFHRLPVLIGAIAGHFLIIAVIDILVIFVAGTCVLLLVCQGLTTLWGLVLSLGFFYTVRSLYIIERNTMRMRNTGPDNLHLQTSQERPPTSPNTNSETLDGGVNGANNSANVPAKIQSISVSIKGKDNKQESESAAKPTNLNQSNYTDVDVASRDDVRIPRASPRRMRSFGRKRKPLRKVIIVGVMTSCLGSLCFILGIYGMFIFSNPLVPVDDVRGWFIYQTLQRSVEFGFGITLSYLAWQRNAHSK